MFAHFSSSKIFKTTQSFLLVMLLIIATQSNAQQTPINISVTVTPPYSSSFEDYVGIAANNVIINLTCSPTANGIQVFYLAGTLSQTGASSPFSIIAPVLPQPNFSYAITMSPGQLLSLRGSDLQPYFDESRIVYENISQQQINTFYANKFIPEGNYQICLTAHDYDTQAQVSPATPSGCSNIFTIRNVDPPIISNPSCQLANDAGHIAAGAFQNINFLWNPPIGLPFNSNIAYTFQMVEVPIGMNPNQLFQNTTFIPFEVNTGNQTSFYYNSSHPPLVIGKRYAIRVRAEDYSGALVIRNEGYSEVCSFIYGLPNEIENFENATLIPTVNIISGAQLFYFEEFLEATNNVLRVQPAVSSNSSNITHPNDFTISASIKSISNENGFEITTKREISVENILHFNTSNLQAVMYHGLDIAKAFGKFEQDKFTFTGNPALLRNYLAENNNKFILPPGQYTIEIQLMQANGITPVSQLSSFNFSVSYPHYIQNISIPPSMNVNVGNTLASSNAIAANLRSVAMGYTNVQLYNRFAVEIQSVNEINPSQQFKIKLTSSAENCAIISNETNNGSNLSFEKLNCILKQFNASEFKLQTGGSGSWINLPDEYSSNGKLLLPAGNYKLYLKAYLKNSEIPLTDPNSGIVFSTTGEAGTAFPLEVSTQLLGPVHGFKLWAERSESAEFKNISYIRNTITPVNASSGNNLTIKLRYKIEKTASSSSPEFVLKLKDSYQPNNEFIIGNVAQVVKYPDNLSAFGNFIQGNWEMVNSANIPLSELFPNGELRLPPGEYKLFCWATNASGTIELSSPSAYTEFVLGTAFDYQLVNERTILPSGKLTEYYNVDPLPILKITKTKDLSTAVFRTFASIKGISGPLSGKQFELKQTLMMDGAPIMLINGYHTHTYSDLATVMANSFATQFLLDGQAVPTNYTIGDANTNIDYLKLPPGSYEICYQTYSEKLHFKLGPDNGYCRTFEVDGSTLNASSEFNCEGTTPPEFQLRAVYPAMNDTLPFRLFPFIVQYCPYSDNFRGAEGTFRIHKSDGTLTSLSIDINNNWPNGPRLGQFNAINGYPEQRFNPPVQISELDATFLPVYNRFEGALEFPTNIMSRGNSYHWYTQLFLRHRTGNNPETSRSQIVDQNKFGLGMTKPILNEPENNSTLEAGNVEFKFRKGRIPSNLLPPIDILQTQRLNQGSHQVLTYDGTVNEAYVIQVSNREDFSTVLHTSPPVRINTSYREMIALEDPSHLVDLLYGNVETEFNISNAGDYYWRVGWLNNPENEGSGFYNSSPTYKFTIGTPEQLTDIDLNCGTPVTNTTFHSWPSAQLVNQNICIGKFTMQVKEIRENANQTYQGFGIVRWMDVPFKVVFSDLKINREKQVFSGTARGAKQIPNAIADWIRTNMSSLEAAFLGAPGENNAEAAQGINTASSVGTSIVNQIASISNAVNGQATMPFGLNFNMTDLEGQNRSFVFALMDLQFTKDNAKMSALLDMDFPDPTLSSILELAATGVTIKPGGFDGSEFTFFLPRDKEIPLSVNSDFKFGFKGCSYTPGTDTQNPVFYNNGTYFKYKKASETTSAYWEAGLGVSLKIKAGDDKILKKNVPAATSTTTPSVSDPNYVTFSGQTIVTAGGGQSAGFIFTLTGNDKFGFTDVPNLELECNSLVVDLSPGSNNADLNHTKLNEIKGLTSSSTDENQPSPYTAGNSSLFKGIYFKSISGKYKKVFGDDLTIGLNDLLIDFGDGGFYGTLYAKLDAAAKLAGWKIKENEIGVEFKNSLKKAYLKGKIEMPIAQSDPLKYECNIKKENDTYAVNFNVSTGEQLKADLLLAKLNLSNSSINVKIPFNDDPVSVKATLNGNIAIELPNATNTLGISNPQLIAFNDFKLSSKSEADITNEVIPDWLYVNNGITAGASTRSTTPTSRGEGSSECFGSSSESTGSTSAEKTINLGGFGATLSKFGLKFDPQSPGSDGTLKVKLGMKFNLDLRLGPTPTSGNSDEHFAITAGGEISLYGGNLTYNTNNGFGFELSPDVKLGNCFRVSGKIGPAEIGDGSGLEFFDNPTKGKGFDLRLRVKLALGEGSINPDIAMQLVVGSKGVDASKFKYFGLGIEASGFKLPVAPPFNLTGLGGGLAVNMINPRSFDSEELVCSGAGPNVLGNLTPQKGDFYFFVKGTGNVTSDEVVKLCLKIEASISNGALSHLGIVADAKFLAKEPANNGLLYGRVIITYTDDGTSKTFELTAGLQTLPPLPRANVVFALNIEKIVDENPLWFVALGKPADRCSLTNITSAGIATASLNVNFYFISGNDLAGAGILEERPMPTLLEQAIAGKGNVNDARNRDKIDRAKEFYDSYRQTLINLFSEERNSGSTIPGLAMGAELAMELNVDFFLLYFDFSLIAGFNLAMIKLEDGVVCGNTTDPGINNWYAVGDLYAGMTGDLGIKVDVWFYEGKISLFNFGLAAILNGAGPNPWYASGTVYARGEVLGGLIDVDMEMEFSYGQPCPETPFDLNDLKIISDVSPVNNDAETTYRTLPQAGFNLAVSETSEPLDNMDPNTDRRSKLIRIENYEVKYKEGNNLIVRNFCFPLNRFEIEGKLKEAPDSDYEPIVEPDFYANGGGRPTIGANGKTATANLGNGTLLGTYKYRVKIEVEVLELRNGKWIFAQDKIGNRTVYRRRLESYSLGAEVDNDNVFRRNLGNYTFTTLPAPTDLQEEDILYTTPIIGQRNFHEGDNSSVRTYIGFNGQTVQFPQNNWKVTFSTFPSYLYGLPEWAQRAINTNPSLMFSKKFFTRFISEDGTISNEEEFNARPGQDWQGSMPSLASGKTYRMELTSRWVGDNEASEQYITQMSFTSTILANASVLSFVRLFSNSSGNSAGSASTNETKINAAQSREFNENDVYNIHFRNSNYRTFNEKLQAINFTSNWQGDVLTLSSPTANFAAVPERFDEIELKGYKILDSRPFSFPPLYQIRLLPEENFTTTVQSPGKAGSNEPPGIGLPITLSPSVGSLSPLSKLYKDGFFAINSNLSPFGEFHGITFFDSFTYQTSDINTPQNQARLLPNTEAAKYGNINNALAYFPAGAIRITYNNLDGKLSDSEKYKGYLSRYKKNAPNSNNQTVVRPIINPVGVNPQVTLTGISSQQPAHISINIEIQKVVNNDIRLYKEILLKGRNEMDRLLKDQFNGSNEVQTKANLNQLMTAIKGMVLDQPTTVGIFAISAPRISRDNLLRRLYCQNPTAFAQDPPWGPTFNTKLGILNRVFFNYLVTGNTHPHAVFPTGEVNGCLIIEEPYARMHHALNLYKTTFRQNIPSESNFNTFFSELDIEGANIFKDKTTIRLSVRQNSGIGSRSYVSSGSVVNVVPEDAYKTTGNVNIPIPLKPPVLNPALQQAIPFTPVNNLPNFNVVKNK